MHARSAFRRVGVALPVLFVALTSIGYAQQKYVANPGTANAPTPTIEIFNNVSSVTPTGSVSVAQGPPLALALGPRFEFRRFVFGTLYVATGTGRVVQYGVDGNSGALTLQSSVAAGSIPSAMIATGQKLYVANRGSNSISVFSIDQSTGNLSQFQTVTGVSTPSELALDPIQNLLVASAGPGFCSFRVQPAGDLSAPMCTPPLPPSVPVPAPSNIIFVNSVLYITVNTTFRGLPVSQP